MADQSKRERLNVRFPAKMSLFDKCVCTACHGLGQVMQVKLPTTEYRGVKMIVLSTAYDNYWLCNDCRRKLVEALLWGYDDEAD